MTDTPAPTERDKENAAFRAEISRRQAEEYDHCLPLAMGAFGPGWEPARRHYLVDKQEEDRCRRTGERPRPAATVYTVKHKDGRRRRFTVTDGKVTEHIS